MLDINLFREGQHGHSAATCIHGMQIIITCILLIMFWWPQTRGETRRSCASLNGAGLQMWALSTRCWISMYSGGKVSWIGGASCDRFVVLIGRLLLLAARFAMEQAKKEFNALNKQIAELKKVRCGLAHGLIVHCCSCAHALHRCWPARGPCKLRVGHGNTQYSIYKCLLMWL